MNSAPTLSQKRDLILTRERRFAAQVSARVIDKPKLALWMILIPVFFVFYFWQLKRYADGRKTFAANFLITRQRALDESLRSAESGEHTEIEKVIQVADIPADCRQAYRAWVSHLLDHYHDLLSANGSSYPDLVRSVYRSRTNFLLFLNRLNRVEREFNATLKPHLEKSADNVDGIIKLMEESSASLRRRHAEEIFP